MITISKIKYIIPWTAVVLWMTLIFCFSAQEAEQSSQTSSGFSEVLAKLLYSNFNDFSSERQNEILGSCQFIVRKTAHFCVYGMLGILTFTACRVMKLKLYPVISPAICLLYAISDEVHQNFVEGRSAQVSDVLLDFCGSVTGVVGMAVIFAVIGKFMKRGKK